MSMYPTAIDYRLKPGGTVRDPAIKRPGPRRKPGRPPARIRPTYRPSPVRLPGPPRLPSLPAPALRRLPFGWLGKLGPYGIAFEFGFLMGSILFGGMTKELRILNPGGWAEYICPTGPSGPLTGPVTTVWTNTLGVSLNNCIQGQFIGGSGTAIRRGFWEDYGSLPAYKHVVSFYMDPPASPAPTARYGTRPVVYVDPAIEEWLGNQIWANPLASPVAGVYPGIGPWAPSPFAPGLRPSPGVGPEGYISGEPSGTPALRPNPGPSVRPKPNPNPKRPGKGVKEVKTRRQLAVNALGNIYGQITEVEDLLDVVMKSLKKGCARRAPMVWVPGGDTLRWRRVYNGKFSEWKKAQGQYRAPTFLEKFDVAYRHADCIDMAKFWENYIDNQAEDYLGGLLGGKTKEIPKKLRPGTSFGVQFGPAL